MLQPRESDIPAVFLVLVVLPLVAYILLGKWSEAAKKKERISMLAELAAEESLRAEAMVAASVIPLVPSSKNGVHVCAQCFGPATTRCSRCKSIRYCSGKCQIVHWREIHKEECQQMETNSSSSSPRYASNDESVHERFLFDHNMNYGTDGCTAVDKTGVSLVERRSIEKRLSRKPNRDMLRKGDGAILESPGDATRSRLTCSTSSSTLSNEDYMKQKLRNGGSTLSEEEIPHKSNVNISGGYSNGLTTSRGTTRESHKTGGEHDIMFDSRNSFGTSSSSSEANNGMNMRDEEGEELNCSSETTSTKRNIKSKSESNHLGTKMYRSSKSMKKGSRERSCSETDRNGQIYNDSKIARIRDTSPTKGSNGISSMGIMKMIGLRKSSKLDRHEMSEVTGDKHKILKMLFPYEEFVKFFQYEVFDLSPRGLMNCGNSCYANAVLQCLTSTKPLIIYLLRRSHSRSCCGKNWCLMCELEQHVMTMRESGGPLSPGRILSHMRSINCQIGDGSQEDAHEFLRLLITSMQSICLEGLGGEKVVDPRLQETTFIQHTFGGRLRSKVKCLKCHHESERYENIMDLTLEINGWVESLEDALTQFTTPEDLDGENMYRCGRCSSYVRAWKQLRIHEAPNILTIVLKRFQEGSYGKINKCITFPEMLDMIPFMTGKDDVPPLYLLYALVVHLDTHTLNASFSGHYVSYVKDLQGNWFRIDDTQVQPVPMGQVMSEGAYILFYMRSSPRPVRSFTGKSTQHQPPGFAKLWSSKPQKSSRQGEGNSSNHFIGEPLSHHRPSGLTNLTSKGIFRNANTNELPVMETCSESYSMEFSDATSSDFSIFTSSDEASFTTESTRDSFSTVDYADPSNIDAISSIFNTSYGPDYSYNRTVSCSMFSRCKPETRFVSERKGVVFDMNLSEQLESFHIDSYGGLDVKCNRKDGICRTSCNCKI